MVSKRCIVVYFDEDSIKSVDFETSRNLSSIEPIAVKKANEHGYDCVVISCHDGEEKMLRRYDGKWVQVEKPTEDRVTIVKSLKGKLLGGGVK